LSKPTIHATCLVIGEHGVLLRGPSGAGKSRLALHFIETAAAKGRFVRLVGDDRIRLVPERGRLIAYVPDAIAGLIERRSSGSRELGIEKIDYLPSAPVALVVDIFSDAEFFTGRPRQARRTTLEGIELAYLAVPRDFTYAVARIEAILPLL
jgi:HPr kinase/phosphorylase